jgi:hypothetical protein
MAERGGKVFIRRGDFYKLTRDYVNVGKGKKVKLEARIVSAETVC